MFDDDRRPGPSRGAFQRSPRLLQQVVGVLVLAIFVTDLLQPKITALSALYAIPIMLSLWLSRPRLTQALALACCVLALLGLTYGEPGDPWLVIANRSVALFAIAVVTSLGLLGQRAELQASKTRRIALTTLRSIGDAVLTANESGRVTFVNRAAEGLLGRSREDLFGRPLETVFQVREERSTRGLPPIEELPEPDPRPSQGYLQTPHRSRVPIEIQRSAIQSSTGLTYGQVLVFRDVTRRRAQEEAMRRMAYRDELTGLPNRTSLLDRLVLELAHARRNREALGLLYLDLDGFKDVNDRHGHHAGDALLVETARRLRTVLRAGDTVARLGGDEFTIVLPGIADAVQARRVADKVLEAIEQPVAFEGHELRVSASIGVVLNPGQAESPDELLRHADEAMYAAKQAGRRRVVMSPERGTARR